MTKNQVSFLMPVRNGYDFIAQALKSTLKTMDKEDRLYVVLDSSSDGSEEIARRYEQNDSRVILLENPGENGVANALNYGLAHIETEFVARIDADDMCLPWRRGIALRQLKSKRLDFFFSTAVIFGQGVRFPAPQPFVGLKNDDAILALAHSNPMIHSSMVARTLAIRDLGGYIPGPSEDYDLWARACLAGYRIQRHGFPTVLYRVHRAQLTRSKEWAETLSTPTSVLELRNRLGIPLATSNDPGSLPAKIRSWYFL